ncbi:hypothetical protein CHELA1G11_13140 [Hyphomicrobiales bacterium]|nr:hypothetical protein CHELA1G11_13140 [Hyphomicrobiales bacterium]
MGEGHFAAIGYDPRVSRLNVRQTRHCLVALQEEPPDRWNLQGKRFYVLFQCQFIHETPPFYKD